MISFFAEHPLCLKRCLSSFALHFDPFFRSKPIGNEKQSIIYVHPLTSKNDKKGDKIINNLLMKIL